MLNIYKLFFKTTSESGLIIGKGILCKS
jgi:hypothetical protein